MFVFGTKVRQKLQERLTIAGMDLTNGKFNDFASGREIVGFCKGLNYANAMLDEVQKEMDEGEGATPNPGGHLKVLR
jgi:hypothetical protein